MLKKIEKEIGRAKKKIFGSDKKQQRIASLECNLANVPYELYDKIKNNNIEIKIPKINSIDETLDKILRNKYSLARFGDGEISIINGSRIHFQNSSENLAQRLKEIISSDDSNLLIGLPDCFGSLDCYVSFVADFWRKWMSKKREMTYSLLDLNRLYDNAFFTRAYMPFNKTDENYKACGNYFNKVKQIYSGRDVIICEGRGTRFGLFNDLLNNSNSISRILCPERNAFDKYDDILKSFDDISKDKLVLIALGPTATVLAYDLSKLGYQAIDIGHLDLEYEWFLRKDHQGKPIEFKYVDGSKQGRKVHKLKDTVYEKQIIKKII